MPVNLVDLDNIRKFTIPRPNNTYTLFGMDKDFDELPETHREQVFFLDKMASDYIWELSGDVHLTTGGNWEPFIDNFKVVEKFDAFYGTPESWSALKKWLYQRGVPFKTWVFVLADIGNNPFITTWKMVVKYSDPFFRSGDVMAFDSTLNWCLFYFHENILYFGKDKKYDPREDEARMEKLNARKKKYPQFRHPYL